MIPPYLIKLLYFPSLISFCTTLGSFPSQVTPIEIHVPSISFTTPAMEGDNEEDSFILAILTSASILISPTLLEDGVADPF